MKKIFVKCHQDINVSAYFMNCINFSIVSQLFFFLIKKYIYFFMERHSI